MCWKCLATKGEDAVDNCYTNADPGAPWRYTFYSQLPWGAVPPEFVNLVGFDVKMINIDIMHAWHLGVGRDLAGGAIQQLAKLRWFWHGRTQEDRLANATARLRRFCKQRNLLLTLRKLTKANLRWKTDCYPEVRCKAYDTYIILSWLADEVTNQNCGDDDLSTVSWCQMI